MNGCAMDSPECAGRLEWHHAVKQQRLKREFRYGALACPSIVIDTVGQLWMPAGRHDGADLGLDAVLGDPRNRVWLCSHHHELVTNGRLKPQIPESVWEFAREFGLLGMLENDLRRAA